MNLKQIRRLIVIGTGGNGGYLIPNLVRLLKSMNSKIELLIMDKDIVETKNLIRQNFIEIDIGKPKAQVIAERYSQAFDYKVNYLVEYYNNDTAKKLKINGNDIIIGCVDNHKTRLMIDESNHKWRMWIDVANELKSGSLFLNYYESNNSTRYRVFDYYPELINEVKNDHPDELSCADHLESGEQKMGINLLSSIYTFNAIESILNGIVPIYYLLTYNTNNVTRAYMISEYKERLTEKIEVGKKVALEKKREEKRKKEMEELRAAEQDSINNVSSPEDAVPAPRVTTSMPFTFAPITGNLTNYNDIGTTTNNNIIYEGTIDDGTVPEI